jgi:hypothetical protein
VTADAAHGSAHRPAGSGHRHGRARAKPHRRRARAAIVGTFCGAGRPAAGSGQPKHRDRRGPGDASGRWQPHHLASHLKGDAEIGRHRLPRDDAKRMVRIMADLEKARHPAIVPVDLGPGDRVALDCVAGRYRTSTVPPSAVGRRPPSHVAPSRLPAPPAARDARGAAPPPPRPARGAYERPAVILPSCRSIWGRATG